jgi:hypothetical protein
MGFSPIIVCIYLMIKFKGVINTYTKLGILLPVIIQIFISVFFAHLIPTSRFLSTYAILYVLMALKLKQS